MAAKCGSKLLNHGVYLIFHRTADDCSAKEIVFFSLKKTKPLLMWNNAAAKLQAIII